MGIVTRIGKDSKLTIKEMDDNWLYLENNLLNISLDNSVLQADMSVRISNDLSLSTSISSEISERISSDLSLSTSIVSTTDNKLLTVNIVDVTYTLQITDNGSIINLTNSTPIQINIPLSSAINIPIGTKIIFKQENIGEITFIPILGVTLNSFSSFTTINGQYNGAILVKTGINTWWLYGDLKQTTPITSLITPTVTPTVETYTYNGSVNGPNIATNTGTGTNYTFSYVGVSGTSYTASSIRPSLAGNYTVTASVAADGNYDSASSSATPFTIDVATPIVTPTIESYIYSGNSQGPNSATNTGTGTNYTFSYVGVSGTSYETNATPPTSVGSYTVTATVEANGNFGSASSSATAFTIDNIAPITFDYIITPTGDGSGVATLTLQSNQPTILTLGTNAKFYIDLDATINESSTWTCSSEAPTTIYIKCSSSTTLTIESNRIVKWIDWISGINSPNIDGDISKLPDLTYLNVIGNNTLYGSITNLLNLTHLLIN